MIYIQVPKPDAPSGGVWFLYRLVQLLNELGIDTRAWQKSKENYAWWDAHPIPDKLIVKSPRPGKSDTIIIPETSWPIANANGAREILFVQNYIWLDKFSYVNKPGETLVCSRFLANYMKDVFQANVIGKITPFLDDDLWKPTPKKSDVVLVMGRRNEYHSAMAQALSDADFQVRYVVGPQSQQQLFDILSECEFYVHLNHPEGFPMACLEAMRMGTIVVGTTGGGGNEFLHHRETAIVVQDPENGRYGSGEEFVNRIMEQMRLLRADDELRSRLWTQAHAWSLRYTAEATKEELKAIFQSNA